MIDRRLFQLVEGKSLSLIVSLRLLQLVASVITWLAIAQSLSDYLTTGRLSWPAGLIAIILACWLSKAGLRLLMEKYVHQASAELRLTLRQRVFQQAVDLGDEKGQLPATTLTQLSVDGIEQVEIYFSRFLPQLFYCLLASLLLFSYYCIMLGNRQWCC